MTDSTRPQAYLHVVARYTAHQRWPVFQVTDEPPRITLADSVTS